jgi:exopolysaccharide biosynthesis polyprenyl glycosylphosphotransferase
VPATGQETQLLLRRYSEVFRTLCALADLAVVSAAFAGAYALRFHTEWVPAPPGPHEVAEYGRMAALSLPLFLWLLRYRGMYEARRGRSPWEEARILVEVSILGTLGLAAATFFFHNAELSRLMLTLFGVECAIGLVALRASIRGALAFFRRRGFNQRRVLVVGSGALAREVCARFANQPDAGFTVVGVVGQSRPSRDLPNVLGPYELLREIVEDQDIDQVVLALDRNDTADPIKLIEEMRDSTAALRIAPDLLGLNTVRLCSEDFDGLPMICLVENPALGWHGVVKRTIDLVVASALLIGLSPLLLAVGGAIRWSTPRGPVFYRQRRMSIDGRIFTMLKFRTMIPDAEAGSGPRWTTRDDPRRTRLGALLRRTNLDELPQLWNVVRGEMSLVGPRPERPELIQEFRKRVPGYMLRHKVKGGLTGLAQINGFRGQTSLEGRLEQDLLYAQTWSLALDLKILTLTLLRAFRDPNAY